MTLVKFRATHIIDGSYFEAGKPVEVSTSLLKAVSSDKYDVIEEGEPIEKKAVAKPAKDKQVKKADNK
jgi:hypothetical protein